MLFDSHTHINFQAFNEDRDAVLSRCAGVPMLIMNVGAAIDTSTKAVEIALANDFSYATIGLHPIHVYDEEFNPKQYQQLIEQSAGRVKAIGECGIDYWHIKRPDIPLGELKAKQKEVFEAHISLAQKNDLALMIHGRNGAEDMTAYKDIYEIVESRGVKRATVHCYGGDLEEALMFTSKGFYIGITGIITFDKTGRLDEIVQAVKLENLLIETDAPYLTPVPYRGKRNEPPYVLEVARHIAKVKGLTTEEVVEATCENAKILFNIA